MSEEIALADANLTEIARLRAELSGMHREYEQLREALLSERAARETTETQLGTAHAEGVRLTEALRLARGRMSIRSARKVIDDALREEK